MKKNIIAFVLCAALSVPGTSAFAMDSVSDMQETVMSEDVTDSYEEFFIGEEEALWEENPSESFFIEETEKMDIEEDLNNWSEEEILYEEEDIEVAEEEDLFSEDMDIFSSSYETGGLIYPTFYGIMRESYDLVTVQVSSKGYTGGSFHWLIQDALNTEYSTENPPPEEAFHPADQEDVVSDEFSHSFVVDTSNVEIWVYLKDKEGKCSSLMKLLPQSRYSLSEEEKAVRSGFRNAVLKLKTKEEAIGASVYYKILKSSEEVPAYPWSSDGFINGGVVTDTTISLSLASALSDTKKYPAVEISSLRCLVYLIKEESGKRIYSDGVICTADTWPVIDPGSVQVTAAGDKFQVTGSAKNAYLEEKKEGYEVIVQHTYQYLENDTLKNYIKTEVLGRVGEDGRFEGTGNVPALSMSLKDSSQGVSYKLEYKNSNLGVRFMKAGDNRYYYSPGYTITIPRVTPTPAVKPDDPGVESSIVKGLENEYLQGQKIVFRVTGAGMNNKTPKIGDVRYNPYRWRASTKECTIEQVLGWKNANGEEQGLFKVNSLGESCAQTSASSSIAAGSYPITFVYLVEKWDGTKWVSEGYEKQVKYFKLVDNASLSSKYIKLTGIKNEKNGVTLTWNPINGVPQYRVFRKTGSGSWKKVTDTAKLSYKDASVSSNTVYTYTVRGISADGKSYITGYDPAGLKVNYFATPVLKSISSSGNTITISWNAAKGVSRYRVYRKSGSEGWRRVGDTSALNFTDTKLSGGITYTYTVRGISADGKKYTSNYDNVGLTTTILLTPSIYYMDNTASGIRFNWYPVEGAEGYIVYRKAGNETHWSVLATIKRMESSSVDGGMSYEKPVGTIVSYTDTLAEKNGCRYTYTVRAYKGNVKSGYIASGTSIFRVFGSAITSITSPASGKIKLNWNKNGVVSGYLIEYSVRNTFVGAKRIIAKNGVSSATISDLISGRNYYVRMRSFKIVNGKCSYSQWSGSKVIKVK